MANMVMINGEANFDVIQGVMNVLNSIPKDTQPGELIEKAKECLDQNIGPWNWDFEISGIQVMELKKNEVSCVLTGILSIRDDQGVKITRSAIGKGRSAADIIMSIQSAADIALARAYVLCINGFSTKNKKNSRARPKLKDAVKAEVSEEVRLLCVSVKTCFTAMKAGGAKCQVQENDSRVTLIIWPDNWDQLHKKYPESFAIGNKLNNLRFMGSPKEFKGKGQIIFHSLPEVKANG